MKVAELIKALEKQPQDADILVEVNSSWAAIETLRPLWKDAGDPRRLAIAIVLLNFSEKREAKAAGHPE
jgi:hypothetical protein